MQGFARGSDRLSHRHDWAPRVTLSIDVSSARRIDSPTRVFAGSNDPVAVSERPSDNVLKACPCTMVEPPSPAVMHLSTRAGSCAARCTPRPPYTLTFTAKCGRGVVVVGLRRLVELVSRELRQHETPRMDDEVAQPRSRPLPPTDLDRAAENLRSQKERLSCTFNPCFSAVGIDHARTIRTDFLGAWCEIHACHPPT